MRLVAKKKKYRLSYNGFYVVPVRDNRGQAFFCLPMFPRKFIHLLQKVYWFYKTDRRLIQTGG